ncbi:hypothetical protein B0J13DRAFT_576195 [Dactylonectria estremocensis]|uniref:Secreted protein n=1 Tax=Dactylonectria estremocensis TaxID=1079267 RepID=A0A9P9D387_9HYPO|nr:hypothetical protein B0J13DRAFT_576195 [Dactylonectria estremocensis]
MRRIIRTIISLGRMWSLDGSCVRLFLCLMALPATMEASLQSTISRLAAVMDDPDDGFQCRVGRTGEPWAFHKVFQYSVAIPARPAT